MRSVNQLMLTWAILGLVALFFGFKAWLRLRRVPRPGPVPHFRRRRTVLVAVERRRNSPPLDMLDRPQGVLTRIDTTSGMQQT